MYIGDPPSQLELSCRRQMDSLSSLSNRIRCACYYCTTSSHIGYEALLVWLPDSCHEGRNRYLSPVSYSGVCLSSRNVWFTLMKFVSSSGNCVKSSFHRLWVCITFTHILVAQEKLVWILTGQLSR